MKSPSRIAIVVGEDSGDLLGAGLIKALKARYPDCIFEGVGGRRMLAEGFISHHAMDRLAVMGLIEPLKRLPELLGIRKSLRLRYSQNPPDVFIGIDAPDFNLSLELALREKGVKTVHYVSPSVWAWRQGRVKKIARAVDLMLTLFPFEAAFYQDHRVPVVCVGHTLADQIPLEDKKYEKRQQLGLDAEGKYLAILPGSRKSEVEKLCRTFLQAAELCRANDPNIHVLIPAANNARYEQITSIVSDFPKLNVQLSKANSHDVMAVADVVLIASGTSTLEALLLKRPMVIAYRVAGLTFWLLKRLVKSKYVGLPNLLAGKSLVPELLQDQATPENISAEIIKALNDDSRQQQLINEYVSIHQTLKKNADETAASAVENLLKNS